MLRRLVVGAALMAGCADPTANDLAQGIGSWSGNEWTSRVIITGDPNDSQWPADPVTIHSAVIKGDSLELSVSYGGGCRDHWFALLANGAWMESYPVQTGIRLAHDAKGDGCKALLTRTLRFDLEPLKAAYASSYQAATGIIRLNLAGATASITYSW